MFDNFDVHINIKHVFVASGHHATVLYCPSGQRAHTPTLIAFLTKHLSSFLISSISDRSRSTSGGKKQLWLCDDRLSFTTKLLNQARSMASLKEPSRVLESEFILVKEGLVRKRKNLQAVGEKWENVCSEGLEEGEQLALVFYFDGK
ncbi:hypothetical protein YC2023_106952 [Brassica napus]